MSTEEDPELRDLIAKCLENNGVLGKLRVNKINKNLGLLIMYILM